MSNEKSITIKPFSIGLGAILTGIFVTLKLLGHIDWSWWWVLAPVWIPWAAMISIVVIGLLIAMRFK